MLVRYILSSGFVFKLPISFVMSVRIFVLIVLSSSNRKYESLAIEGYVMKQWYALYALLGIQRIPLFHDITFDVLLQRL